MLHCPLLSVYTAQIKAGSMPQTLGQGLFLGAAGSVSLESPFWVVFLGAFVFLGKGSPSSCLCYPGAGHRKAHRWAALTLTLQNKPLSSEQELRVSPLTALLHRAFLVPKPTCLPLSPICNTWGSLLPPTALLVTGSSALHTQSCVRLLPASMRSIPWSCSAGRFGGKRRTLCIASCLTRNRLSLG